MNAARIRPFDPECDYPAAVAAINAAAPEYPFTPETLRARDGRFAIAPCRSARWVAEENGTVVGVAQYLQRPDQYDPGRYDWLVYVPPACQGRGIGKALYRCLRDALAPHAPQELRTFTWENRPRALRFLAERRYVETQRDGMAWLDLTAFDSDAWHEAERLPDGIRGATYSQLAARDPDFVEKLCALQNDLQKDVPPRGERTPLEVPTFLRTRLDGSVVRDGSFVAVTKRGAYVGVTETLVPPSQEPGLLSVGLTGVRREWRRQGIACALKLRAIRFCQGAGAHRLRTGNASDNVPILTLNQRLGFVREPWRVHFEKHLPGTDG